MSVRIVMPQTAFRPGESIEVDVEWDLEEQPTRLVCDLLWFTSGKGDEDTEVVLRKVLDAPRRRDSHTFKVPLPDAPYSFSGKLIPLTWSVEVRAEEAIELDRIEITIAPGAREVLL